MENIGVRELRQNASVYLRRAAAGESFTVTDRGRPVGMIVPPPRDGDSMYDAMVARGELIAPKDPGGAAWLEPPLPQAPGTQPLSEVLEQLRDEERY